MEIIDKTLLYMFIIIPIAVCISASAEETDFIVKTKFGRIKGIHADDGDYIKYMGIPYARVNLSNPFGDSIPPSEFTDIFNATEDLPGCLHIDEDNDKSGTIDCLKLNIYIPALLHNKSLPVLVYIHGGDFNNGKASYYDYGPKFIMKRNIILVTFDYRLGPYGFLCTNISEVPINQGLRDQIKALRWIRDNIQDFGGDTQKITLSGHGSGSICAHIHLLYGKEHLFNQVILASGTAFLPSIIRKPDNKNLFKLSKKAGLITDDPLEAFNFISKVNPRKLIKYDKKLRLSHSICIENNSDSLQSIVVDYPAKITIIDRRINMLMSNTVNNADYVTKENMNSEDFKTSIYNYLKNEYGLNNSEIGMFKTILYKFYFNSNDEIRKDFMNFVSDLKYHYPTKKTIAQYTESKGNIFLYEFMYKGERNFMQNSLNMLEKFTTYEDDLGYLFEIQPSYFFHEYINQNDQLIIRRLTKIWANFVKYGTPIPRPTKLLPTEWSPIGNNTLPYINFDLYMTLKRRPFHERMAFWDLFNDIIDDNTSTVKRNDVLEDDLEIESSGDYDYYSK